MQIHGWTQPIHHESCHQLDLNTYRGSGTFNTIDIDTNTSSEVSTTEFWEREDAMGNVSREERSEKETEGRRAKGNGRQAKCGKGDKHTGKVVDSGTGELDEGRCKACRALGNVRELVLQPRRQRQVDRCASQHAHACQGSTTYT